MTKTTNYNLNQWGATDKIRRADFNADNAKIDAALTALNSGMCHISHGTYVGNGQYGPANSIVLTCDFTPKLVIVQPLNNAALNPDTNHASFITLVLVNPVRNIYGMEDDRFLVHVTWANNSVSWYSNTNHSEMLNVDTYQYQYVILG